MSVASAVVLRRSARFWRSRADVWLAAGLFLVLLAANLALSPGRFAPANWGTLLGLMSPLLLAALAVTPPFLAGRGAIDVSVGPLMGLINVMIVQWLIVGQGLTSPFAIVPFAIAAGILSGALNGFLAAFLRVEPIVVTLGTFLIYSGLSLAILPSPAGSVPPWLRSLSGTYSFVPVLIAVVAWLAMKRTPFYELLMSTGSDDRAAFTAGVNVPLIRLLAFVLAGFFASLGALSLTALIGSGDPAIGPTFTLIAIAAAALGGVSLAGGVGGLASAVIGAAVIYLLQSMLTYFNVSTFVLQLSYGAVLIFAVCLNSEKIKLRIGLGERRP